MKEELLKEEDHMKEKDVCEIADSEIVKEEIAFDKKTLDHLAEFPVIPGYRVEPSGVFKETKGPEGTQLTLRPVGVIAQQRISHTAALFSR